MDTRKWLRTGSLFFFFFFLLSAFQSPWAADKKAVTWGTTSSTSGVFTYYVVTAKILNDRIPEMNVTVRATGGGVHNTRLLEKREVDIGALDTRCNWDAMQGAGPFKGNPFSDLRLLNVSMTNPLQFVVFEKSGVKDIYGLEGKIVTPGMLGGTAEQAGMEIFRMLEIRPKLRHMSYADAIEAMKNEQIVGFVKYGIPDASILDVASAMKIRIISFSDPDLKKILGSIKGFRGTVLPPGTYPGVGGFQTVENEWSDYVRKDFPGELAYKMVKTIWENRAEIKKSNPMFVGDRFTEVALGVRIGFLHPGAVKFYREIGLSVPQSLVPPEMGEK